MTKQKMIEVMNGIQKKTNDKAAFVCPKGIYEVLKMTSRSAPNSRSSSFRNIRQQSDSSIFKTVPNEFAQPAVKLCRSSSDLSTEIKGHIKRVRSFKMTASGLLNETFTCQRRTSNGSSSSYRSRLTSNCSSSSYRSRLTSDTSEDSTSSGSSSYSSSSSGYYKISIMGANGVGKSSLETRFMNSEHMSGFDFDNLNDKTLSVVLDNEESTVEFLDYYSSEDDIESYPADAYIIVFSVHDNDSFVVATKRVQYLRDVLDSDRPVILVANKVDLVRKRQVSADEARQLASEYDCKYIETSAVLNHKVDELFVGVLKQIKLKLNPEAIEKAALQLQDRYSKHSTCKGPKQIFSRLFKRHSKSLSKCDNLFSL